MKEFNFKNSIIPKLISQDFVLFNKKTKTNNIILEWFSSVINTYVKNYWSIEIKCEYNCFYTGYIIYFL